MNFSQAYAATVKSPPSSAAVTAIPYDRAASCARASRSSASPRARSEVASRCRSPRSAQLRTARP